MAQYINRRQQAVRDPYPTLTEKEERRFFAKVSLPDSNGCMWWRASVTHSGGYGQFSLRSYQRRAHRIMYWLMTGTRPDVIDHLCGNAACVAPLHLEDVSQKINVSRGGHNSARAVRENTCKRGHSDWHIRPNGKRYCKECKRIMVSSGKWKAGGTAKP